MTDAREKRKQLIIQQCDIAVVIFAVFTSGIAADYFLKINQPFSAFMFSIVPLLAAVFNLWWHHSKK
jgi:hypothetical protein